MHPVARKKQLIKPIGLIIVLIYLAICGFLIQKTNTTDAISASGFKAGRIIDDAIFYDANSMNADQIQKFLESKAPGACNYTTDAWHILKSKDPKNPNAYSSFCLKELRLDTKQREAASGYCGALPAQKNITAAKYIYSVAQACGINPQVLLVLLEKEQGMITDTWINTLQYGSATGYACPDFRTCNPRYAGFDNQIYEASRQFKVYQKNPSEYNYISARSNRISWQAGGGTTYENKTGSAANRNENGLCGYGNVTISNQSTAALYIYTPYQPNQKSLNSFPGTGDACSAYGNRNFWFMFTSWFGSTYNTSLGQCDSKQTNIVCVWSVTKQDGSQFLTSSKNELINTVNNLGWSYDGLAFYASDKEIPGSTPVYRLRQDARHYWTANLTEYTEIKSSTTWVDEGVRFYVSAAESSNAIHTVYKVRNLSTNHHYWTNDKTKRNELASRGFTQELPAFNTYSGFASPAKPSSGRDNIYELKNSLGYLYTSDLFELEVAMRLGYVYTGVLSTSNSSNNGTPTYRLQRNGKYLFTTNITERNDAINRYGYKDEGVRFYIDNATDQIYRFYNTRDNYYQYLVNTATAMSLVNTANWTYNSVLVEKNSNTSPVYRFTNLANGRHFYTLDWNEAMSISNKGWRYERIAFYASSDSGAPIYRLYGRGAHFYTSSASERDNAINRLGYSYEGIKFYVSATPTNSPIYRLYGNGAHFYTSSASERDNAINRLGYSYEGVRFYLAE